MNENTEIRCPKCNSNQLTSNKKGFSGAKAVGGALLTGGIGLLAGTIGSNKVVITCLACGHKFKPGQGKVVTVSQQQTESTGSSSSHSASTTNSPDPIDQRIIEISQQQGKLAAVRFCKDAKGWDLEKSKNYVDQLTASNNVSGKKEGCFIATACYGNYDAVEVMVLREYRDKVLKRNLAGRMFVKIYYFLSPPLARLIANSNRSKIFIRNRLLKHLVAKLNHTKNNK